MLNVYIWKALYIYFLRKNNHKFALTKKGFKKSPTICVYKRKIYEVGKSVSILISNCEIRS